MFLLYHIGMQVPHEIHCCLLTVGAWRSHHAPSAPSVSVSDSACSLNPNTSVSFCLPQFQLLLATSMPKHPNNPLFQASYSGEAEKKRENHSFNAQKCRVVQWIFAKSIEYEHEEWCHKGRKCYFVMVLLTVFLLFVGLKTWDFFIIIFFLTCPHISSVLLPLYLSKVTQQMEDNPFQEPLLP